MTGLCICTIISRHGELNYTSRIMPRNLNEFQYAAKAKIAWIIYAGRDVNLCTLHRHTAADPQNYERYRDIKRDARLSNQDRAYTC